MKYRFLFILLMAIALHSSAQRSMPLYSGTIINNKVNEGLRDTARTFITANGQTGHFLTRIIAPEVYVYLPTTKNTGAAVIICPGGGYSGLAIDHEGHDMARRFANQGIAGIVLKNRMPNPLYVINKSIVPLQDAQRAIQLVRENAKAWKIKPNLIGILGSSAGGHLASTAGTHFATAVIDNPGQTSLRPDFMILNYPVISFADSISHHGSRDNLIRESPNHPLDEKLVLLYSNELQVTPSTPPVYITHSYDDPAVPVANSIVFIAACQRNKVPVKSFFYTAGGHGYGMHNPTSPVDWFDDCLAWIKRDILKKKS